MEKGLDRPIAAIGLMSGTSLDSIDAALVITDGVSIQSTGDSLTISYDTGLRGRLREILGCRNRDRRVDSIERELTLAHRDAVRQLLDKAGLGAREIGIVGFHGQTVMHAPEEGDYLADWRWRAAGRGMRNRCRLRFS